MFTKDNKKTNYVEICKKTYIIIIILILEVIILKLPLVLCSLMFVIGAWLGVIIPTNYIVFFTITVAFMLVFRYLRFNKSGLTSTIYITVLILLFTAGVYRASFVRNYNISEINPFVGQQIQLCGEVVGIQQAKVMTLIDVKAYWIECNNERKQINSKIRVRVFGIYDKYDLRDVITLTGKLDKLPQMQFWGDISKRSTYGAKGMFAEVNTNAVEIIGHNNLKIDFLKLGYMARNKICEIIDKKLPNDEGALLKGILVGDKSDFTEEMQSDLKLSGLSHIAAVSGVNISIFLMVIAYMINYFGIKRRVNAIIMIIATVIFMVVIGDQPTVLRAGVMMLFTIFMVNLKLRNDMLSSLFFATFVITLFNPYLTHDIGFQLSFFAVLGLILYVDKIGRNVLAASIGVFIVISPVIAYYFNVVTFAALFSNILIELLLVIVLPLGYVVWLIPNIAIMLYPLLKAILFISEFFASIKYLVVPVASPSIHILVIYAIFMYILYEWLRGSTHVKTKKMFVAFIILIAVITNLGYNIIVNREVAKVNFISVGQADCVHIRTPKGLNILIDSGLAQSKVASYLDKQGVSKIDLLFVTSYSKEHTGSVVGLVKDYKVNKLMLPTIKDSSKEITFNKPNNTEIIYYNDTGEIRIDESTTLKILMKNPKNAVTTVQLHCYNTSIMLPSDIDTDGESELVNNYKNGELQSDILLVANNGSEKSTSEAFINAVKPKYPIISAAVEPQDVILQRLSSLARMPIRTDLLGTITVKIGKDGIHSIDTTRCGDEE